MTVCLFCFIFKLLFLLLVCSILCKEVCGTTISATSPSSEKSVTIFEKESQSCVVNFSNNKETKVTSKEYYSPLLVLAGDVIIALTGVTSTEGDNKHITVLTKYIDTKSERDWRTKIANKDSGGTVWKASLGVKKEINSGTNVVKGFLSTANKNKIYVLLVNCTSTNEVVDQNSELSEINCQFEVDVGTIAQNEQNGKKISWEKPESTSNTKDVKLKLPLEKDSKFNNPIFGRAFITNEDNIMFVAKAKSDKNKNITLLVHLQSKGDTLEGISVNEITEKCHPYIFPWNKTIIKITTPCNNEGTTNIQKSTNLENKWDNIEEPLSRLADFFKDKKYFTTADIDGKKKLIIFIQEIKTQDTSNIEKRYLWISDGTRAKQVGEITIDSECIAPTGLFVVNNELFLFTQKCDSTNVEVVCLTRLEKNIKEIQKALTAWNNNEEDIQQVCTETKYKNIFCSTVGLVGYLSNTLTEDNSKWQDKYLFSNPTLKEEKTITPNGIKFKGKDAGAQWDVTKNKNERPYNFIDSGCTFLATVTVHQITKGQYNSILGIVFDDKKIISLLCNGEEKWVVGEGDEPKKLKPSNEYCRNDNTYQIALILKHPTELTVYINGKKLNDLSAEIIEIAKTKRVSSFYFGVDNEQETFETHVTIGNVLLYNRPFDSGEIAKLKVDKQEDQLTGANKDNGELNMAVQQSVNGGGSEISEDVMGGGGNELTPVTEEVVPSSTQQRESVVGNNVKISVNVVMLYLTLLLYVVRGY